VLIDTAALAALGNKREDWHDRALAVSGQLTLAGCCFVTRDTVWDAHAETVPIRLRAPMAKD